MKVHLRRNRKTNMKGNKLLIFLLFYKLLTRKIISIVYCEVYFYHH